MAFAFSPDGSRLVTGLAGTNNLGLWKMPELELIGQLPGHVNGANDASFSPDGTLFATGGGFRASDLNVKIWGASHGTLFKTLVTSNTYGVDAVAFSPDGRVLATGTDDLSSFAGQVELWDTTSWTLLRRLPTKGHLLEFSADGELLITVASRHQIDFWRVRTGEHLHSISTLETDYAYLTGLELTPDGGTLILTGGFDDGHLTALDSPILILGQHRKPWGLELDWNHPRAILQARTNWNEPWFDLAPWLDGSAVAPFEGESTFRLRMREEGE